MGRLYLRVISRNADQQCWGSCSEDPSGGQATCMLRLTLVNYAIHVLTVKQAAIRTTINDRRTNEAIDPPNTSLSICLTCIALRRGEIDTFMISARHRGRHGKISGWVKSLPPPLLPIQAPSPLPFLLSPSPGTPAPFRSRPVKCT